MEEALNALAWFAHASHDEMVEVAKRFADDEMLQQFISETVNKLVALEDGEYDPETEEDDE